MYYVIHYLHILFISGLLWRNQNLRWHRRNWRKEKKRNLTPGHSQF